MSVARHLLQELENKLREKGAEYVITLVPKENLEAQVLFEAAGFENLPNHIIMGKPLK
jgi:ribosomal protein S18 acetylase RimI-like enzyme